jgi:hypothetical protein
MRMSTRYKAIEDMIVGYRQTLHEAGHPRAINRDSTAAGWKTGEGFHAKEEPSSVNWLSEFFRTSVCTLARRQRMELHDVMKVQLLVFVGVMQRAWKLPACAHGLHLAGHSETGFLKDRSIQFSGLGRRRKSWRCK